jgi:hypothetical protein
MWGLSLFKSDSLTGFKKNSSAPSSKHLCNGWNYAHHSVLWHQKIKL